MASNKTHQLLVYADNDNILGEAYILHRKRKKKKKKKC